MMREPTNEVWLCLHSLIVVVVVFGIFVSVSEVLLLHIISSSAFVQFSELLLLFVVRNAAMFR